MTKNNEDKIPYYDHEIYFDGKGTICPICGGKIIHPYIGLVTSEQLDEESKCCTWGEVIDEGDSTIGFIPQCKNIHPYTLQSEDNKYVHYDLVEIANTWDIPLNEKVEKLTNYITHLFKDVEKEDVQFFLNMQDNKISDIKLLKSIKNLYIDLTVDDEGKITIKT
jgi:hypothetical protein